MPACATSWRCAAIRSAASASDTRRIPAATTMAPIWSPASSGSARCRSVGLGLSGEASRQPDGRRRHRHAESQGRCRRDARDHAVLLRERPLFPLSRSRARARHRYADRAGHPAGAELQADQEFRGALRRLGAGLARARGSTGSTTMPATRKLIAAAVAAEQVLDLVDQGVTDFHFYTMNRADLVYAVCHLLGLRPQGEGGGVMTDFVFVHGAQLAPSPACGGGVRRGVLLESLRCPLPLPRKRERGRCGSSLRTKARDVGVGFQALIVPSRNAAALGARAHPGARRRHGHDDPGARARRGRLSRRALRRLEPRGARQQRSADPDAAGAIRKIHLDYFRAGADIVSTNTFSSTRSRRPTTACRISRTSSTSRARGWRAPPPTSRRGGRPAALCRRRAWADQPHRIDFAGR